jgi:hypothetical protein
MAWAMVRLLLTCLICAASSSGALIMGAALILVGHLGHYRQTLFSITGIGVQHLERVNLELILQRFGLIAKIRLAQIILTVQK